MGATTVGEAKFRSTDRREDRAGSAGRGRLTRTSVSRVLGRLGALAVLGVVWCLVASAPASADQASFFYTGARQSFTVPSKVTSLDIIAQGGEGGTGLGLSLIHI